MSDGRSVGKFLTPWNGFYWTITRPSNSRMNEWRQNKVSHDKSKQLRNEEDCLVHKESQRDRNFHDL